MRNLAVGAAVEGAAVDGERAAFALRSVIAKPAPAGQGIGGGLPQLGDLLLGRKDRAGEAQIFRAVIKALEFDEPVVFIGDDFFAIPFFPAVVKTQEEHLRLKPVKDVDNAGHLKKNERAWIGEKIKFSVIDNFRGLA